VPAQGGLATFDVSADTGATPEAAELDRPEPSRESREPATVAPPPRIVLPDRPLPMIELTREEFRAADIAKLGRKPGERRAEAGGAPGDSRTVGTAPNGEPLYAAEWYREPTDQELAFYRPKRMPPGGGYGVIACRTIARYRVDDCVEVASGPSGAGFGRAVLNSAWQFQVRPPRKGGQDLVGSWVRIRIDYIPADNPEG
jgi:protein TonB